MRIVIVNAPYSNNICFDSNNVPKSIEVSADTDLLIEDVCETADLSIIPKLIARINSCREFLGLEKLCFADLVRRVSQREISRYS